ncbi:MAG: hypothetical protein V1914_01665 [archaeon]
MKIKMEAQSAVEKKEKEILDIELAINLKDSIENSPITKVASQELKDKILAIDDFELLKVTKTIGSPITIKDAEILNEEMIEHEF